MVALGHHGLVSLYRDVTPYFLCAALGGGGGEWPFKTIQETGLVLVEI